MRRSRRSRWISGIGAAVLAGGVLMASAGLNVTPAVAAPPTDPLAGLPQNWDQVIPAATRFVVLSDFGGAAVRDNETGLVWERTPATIPTAWKFGRFECASRTTGNRKGWRLPSVHELASLLDPSPGVTPPLLPPGHPFTTGTTGVQSAIYWSATIIKANPSTSNAWGVDLSNGQVTDVGDGVVNSYRNWCVRGGMNADEY